MKTPPYLTVLVASMMGTIFTSPGAVLAQTGSQVVPASEIASYPDGRPSATSRMEAKDQGIILKHGEGPNQCDYLGAREALIFEEDGTYHLAVVLDGRNCTWSKKCIGMPSVIKVGDRPAIFYDAPGGQSTSHMNRDLGLAWLDLPLTPPNKEEGR